MAAYSGGPVYPARAPASFLPFVLRCPLYVSPEKEPLSDLLLHSASSNPGSPSPSEEEGRRLRMLAEVSYCNCDKSLIYGTGEATCVTVYIRHAPLRSGLV